jgi:outer membrane biosynthesis protein TonB
MKKFVLFAFVLFVNSAALAQFEHPDLKSGKKQVRSIIIMPVHAEIVKSGMKGGEPMMEESRQLEKNLTPVISDVLRSLGCDVDEKSVNAEALASNPELGYAVDDLQKQFDAELKQMVSKSKDVRKGRFSLGDSVAKLSAGENADALLFVRASGEVLTGGKKAFGWLVTGQKFDTMQMHLGLVDAKTGEVLYFAKPFMLKNPAKDPGSSRTGIEKSFRNFVKSNTTGTAKREAVPQPTTSAAAKPEPTTAPLTVPQPTTPPVTEVQPTPAPVPESQPTTPPVTAPQPAPAPAMEPPATTAPQPAVPVNSPVAQSPTKSAVYFFASRTSAHAKRSSSEVFQGVVSELDGFLKENNVVVREDPIRKRHTSEAEFPKEILLKDAGDSGAAYVLYLTVDRPVSQWVKLTAQCFAMSGELLWEENAGSGMGGINGAGGVKSALEKLRRQFNPRIGKTCFPVREAASKKLAESK